MLMNQTGRGDNTMTYQEYVAAYESLLKTFFGYTSNEVGSLVYAEKLSDLDEANPQHATRYETDQN
jgi:hypothetical protein|tara:strand:- start:2098 stop:2295 length:198 start_codon:yes stop_codon:yes gene_type:complete